MIYLYWISNGLASLHKMETTGNDIDQKPKKIGKFKNDTEAKKACLDHFEKAATLAGRAGREVPTMKFF